MYTFEFVPVIGSVNRDTSANAQVQFSPTGKFIHYTTAGRGFFGRWNGNTYVSLVTPTSGAGTFRSTDWPDDESYLVTIVNETRVELRGFDNDTGVWSNNALSFVALSCMFLVHLTGNYFAAINARPSTSRLAILRVNGNTLEIVSNTSYATSRIWDFASFGNDIYLLTGSDHNIEHVRVSAGVPTIIETLATGSVASSISLSQDGSKFHLTSDDAAQCRIGFTQPLSMISHAWAGKTGSDSAWLFDDKILQVFSPQKYLRVSDDLTSVELANDVEMIDFGNGQVVGKSKNFSRYGDRIAWVKSIPTSTDSAFFVAIEGESTVETYVEVVGLMSEPSASAFIQQNIVAVAEGLVGNGAFNTDSVEMDVYAIAPIGVATVSFENISANLSAVGLMATPEIIANSDKLINALAIAPMGDAYVFIIKPGVCKSPR